MGVQGLVTFLETHRNIYRDVRCRNGRLLIDGCNLTHLLYFNSDLDQCHGGEYAAFEELVEKFITALRACKISPYVVMDGGDDPTDKKLETITKRAQERINKCHQVAMMGGKEGVLPQLANMVFRQTLTRLGVPLVQCYLEADNEIASLASEWRCPVLSSDSDFYIFDLPAGLLPFSHFKWEEVQRGSSQNYIPCKVYNISSFCTLFGIQRQLLPTFAALAGNDYVKLRSIRWGQYAPDGSERPRLEGLVRWLRRFQQPEEALKAALDLMGELGPEDRKQVLHVLTVGKDEYQLPPSTLSRFFIHGVAPPFPAKEEVAALVPDWTRLPLMQARLTAHILNVLLLNRMPCGFPVEAANLPSSYVTSRPIRQVMYGLLLGKGKQLHVEERIREGQQSKIIQVQPTFKGVAKELKLHSLNKVEPAQRLQVLLEALGMTPDFLRRLPTLLRLPVAATCYWYQKAQPTPDLGLLKAVVMSIIDSMKKESDMRNQHRHRRPHVIITHAFNQWQACLKDSIHLNQLLGFPLPEPQVARLYEGTLTHQLVHCMRSGNKPKKFLKKGSQSVKLYQTVLSVIHQFKGQAAAQAKAVAITTETQKKTTPLLQRLPLDDLTLDLQRLFFLCDDTDADGEINSLVRDEQERQFDDMVTVKTRFRAKERINRCDKLELCRKEDSRRWNII